MAVRNMVFKQFKYLLIIKRNLFLPVLGFEFGSPALHAGALPTSHPDKLMGQAIKIVLSVEL